MHHGITFESACTLAVGLSLMFSLLYVSGLQVVSFGSLAEFKAATKPEKLWSVLVWLAPVVILNQLAADNPYKHLSTPTLAGFTVGFALMIISGLAMVHHFDRSSSAFPAKEIALDMVLFYVGLGVILVSTMF